MAAKPKPKPDTGETIGKVPLVALEQIKQALRLGADLSIACKYAKVPEALVRALLARGGLAKRGAYYDLLRQVEQAEAHVAMICLAHIDRAAAKDWRAAAWRLEHLFPETYSAKQRIQHEGPRGGPIQIDSKGKVSVDVAIGLPALALAEIGRQTAIALTMVARAKLLEDLEAEAVDIPEDP